MPEDFVYVYRNLPSAVSLVSPEIEQKQEIIDMVGYAPIGASFAPDSDINFPSLPSGVNTMIGDCDYMYGDLPSVITLSSPAIKKKQKKIDIVDYAPIGASYAPDSGIDLPKKVRKALGIAHSAQPIVQSYVDIFRKPKGKGDDVALPGPSAGATAGVALGSGGASVFGSIKSEYLLLGGAILLILLLGRRR